MNLPDDDRRLFLKLYHSLLLYVNNKHKILKDFQSPEDLFKEALEDIEKLKEKLYSEPDQISPIRSIHLCGRILRAFQQKSWRSYPAGNIS